MLPDIVYDIIRCVTTSEQGCEIDKIEFDEEYEDDPALVQVRRTNEGVSAAITLKAKF